MGIMARTCNLRIWEPKTGGSRKFEAKLSYIMGSRQVKAAAVWNHVFKKKQDGSVVRSARWVIMKTRVQVPTPRLHTHKLGRTQKTATVHPQDPTPSSDLCVLGGWCLLTLLCVHWQRLTYKLKHIFKTSPGRKKPTNPSLFCLLTAVRLHKPVSVA